MLGLKRWTVRLASYSEDWEREFQLAKAELESLLKNLDLQIEHIGSTSIPNMLSKPILDIGIGTGSKEEIRPIGKILTQNGYLDRGDRKDRGGYLLAKSTSQDVVSHHIHILESSDEQWKNYLDFRNKLRADKELSTEYASLKEQLLKVHKGNREKYTNGKNEFIKRVLKL